MDEITLFKIKEWAELVKSANESPQKTSGAKFKSYF